MSNTIFGRGYALPEYKEWNGMRVFKNDFRVRFGVWQGEIVERNCILKIDDNYEFCEVRAYAITRAGNEAICDYYELLGGDNSGYDLLSGEASTSGFGFV